MAYAALTLAIAYPLLGQGYIFALDHAMGPQSAHYYARYITHNADPIQDKGAFGILLIVLGSIMPLFVAQKILWFAPFFLAGYGMHRLAPTSALAPALFAGVMYMLSPFAYVRGVSGQLGVLWAYALAPWFLLAWTRHTASARHGSRRALATAAALLTITAVFQAHGAFLLAALVALHSLVRWVRSPRDWRAIARAPLVLAGWTVLLTASWVVPVLLAHETTLDRITEEDRSFFATTDAGLPSVGVAAATLQGFWRPAYETYYDSWLIVVPFVVLLLAVHGLFARWRTDPTAVTLALAGVAGFVLGVGESSAWTRPFFDLAWDHLPLFRGFRDSHKLLALLALAYAYLAAAGADALLARVRELRIPSPRARAAAPILLASLLVAAPVAAATPLLDGFDGQLGLTQYPVEWEEAERATRDCDGRMVVLPWHLYLDVSWVRDRDHRVTNPAKLHFSCPTLGGESVEAGRTASQSSERASRYADHWLGPQGGSRLADVRALGNLLSPINVQYVLVLKEADWREDAALLARQSDLTLVLENARVIVYENRAERAAAWRTDVVVPLSDVDDLAAMSATRPLAGVAFVPPGTLATSDGGGRVPLAVAQDAWGALHVADAAPRYLLLAPPVGSPVDGWRADGAAPVTMTLDGALPLFDSHATRVTPRAVWLVSAPLWALSIAGVAAMVVWATGSRAARGGAGDDP